MLKPPSSVDQRENDLFYLGYFCKLSVFACRERHGVIVNTDGAHQVHGGDDDNNGLFSPSVLSVCLMQGITTYVSLHEK